MWRLICVVALFAGGLKADISAAQDVLLSSFEPGEIAIVIPVDECGPPQPETSAAAIITEQRPAKPVLGEYAAGGAFGECVRAITRVPFGGTSVPMYSKLQAWNADGSVFLTNDRRLIDTATLAPIDAGPEFGQIVTADWAFAPRWSASDSSVIHTIFANQYRRYRLGEKGFDTVTFDAYQAFEKNIHFEDVSTDGRFIPFVGVKADQSVELFVYDVQLGKKSPVAAPPDLQNPDELPVWVMVTPLGQHVLALWQSQIGVFAYDMQMQPLGRLISGLGHSDIAVDADGVEWYVDFASGDRRSHRSLAGPVVRKTRIPDGYAAWQAGDKTAVQVLLHVDWGIGNHISCRGPRGLGWCAVSTFLPDPNAKPRPLAGEIIQVYLDSIDCWPSAGVGLCTKSDPRIRRLAHHYSNSACGYFAQPHATISWNGQQIAFGSTWGDECGRMESFVLDVPR